MYHLTIKSGNAKTGAIPVSTSDASTCPSACPLKQGGCYAKTGPLGIHWKALNDKKRGDNWRKFVEKIRSLPQGQIWRHNQAGDLPGKSNKIDVKMLAALVAANIGKRGYAYTHKPLTAENARAIKTANDNGFTINLSANNLKHADELKSKNVAPVVVIVETGTRDVSVTPAGNKVVLCPAQTRDNVTCEKCKLCAVKDRSFIIGFLPHGSGTKKANAIAKGN